VFFLPARSLIAYFLYFWLVSSCFFFFFLPLLVFEIDAMLPNDCLLLSIGHERMTDI